MRDAAEVFRPDHERSGAGLESGSRAGVIAAAIEAAVVEHRLTPGMKLSEDQLGSIFGASRTIVRAALQALAHNNIVEITRNRGAHVASPTVDDARHLFEARRIVEGELVRKATAAMTEDDAVQLAELIRRGRQAMDAADRGTAIRLSGEFHLRIAAIAAQPVLRSFLAEMVSRTSLVIALYGRGRLADCGEAEHRALLDALVTGDADRAAVLMARHLDHIERDLDLAAHARPAVTLADALGASLRV